MRAGARRRRAARCWCGTQEPGPRWPPARSHPYRHPGGDQEDDDDITPSAGLVALQLPAGGIYGRVWVDYKSKTEKMTNQTIAHADITSEVLLDYLQTRGKEQKISEEHLNIVAFYEECIKENVV